MFGTMRKINLQDMLVYSLCGWIMFELIIQGLMVHDVVFVNKLLGEWWSYWLECLRV